MKIFMSLRGMVRQGSGILIVQRDGDDFSLSAPFSLAAGVDMPEAGDVQNALAFKAYLASLMAKSAELGVPVEFPVQALYVGDNVALATEWAPEDTGLDSLGLDEVA